LVHAVSQQNLILQHETTASR